MGFFLKGERAKQVLGSDLVGLPISLAAPSRVGRANGSWSSSLPPGRLFGVVLGGSLDEPLSSSPARIPHSSPAPARGQQPAGESGGGIPCLPILWLLWRSKNSLGSPTRREHPLLPGKPEALQACVRRCFICQESPSVSAWSTDVRGAICSGTGGVYASPGRHGLCGASSQLPSHCWHLRPARSLAPVMKADVSVYENTGTTALGAPRAAQKSILADESWHGGVTAGLPRAGGRGLVGFPAMQSTGNAGSPSGAVP